jgi:hypothetical protein
MISMPNQDEYVSAVNNLSHSRWAHLSSRISTAWHSTSRNQSKDIKCTSFPLLLLLTKVASLSCEKTIWVYLDARNGTAPCAVSIRKSGRSSRHQIRCTIHSLPLSLLGLHKRSEDICKRLGLPKKLERESSMYVAVYDLHNHFVLPIANLLFSLF